jgi:hypothetical protein
MSTTGPRKFLPPNSQFKTPKPVWRTPEPTTQTSRSSSSLKLPPPTQFARTPRFAASNDLVDEIDASFENSCPSPTEIKAQRTFRTDHGAGYDDLVDEDDKSEADLSHSKARLVKDEGLRLHRSNYHETTRKTAKLGDTIQDTGAGDFPQPTSKRRKTSFESTTHHDAILISSSGSEDDISYTNNHEDRNQKPTRPATDPFDHSSDLDDNIPSSPTHARTSTSTIPRFKTPAAPASDLHSTKPIFKPPPPSQLGLNTTLLPDAFSPSRQRGKREYIPGGLADTVRNWVLELGTSISKPGSEQSKTVKVARIQHDVEGRCATIRDEPGEQYLLVSQGQQSDASSVRIGDIIEINGGGTSWSIDIGRLAGWEAAGRGRLEGGVDATGERAKSDVGVRVSVLWKMKQ